MNETHATVIKELGLPFYSVVVTDSTHSKILETLGHFEHANEAEMFSVLWNHMLSADDVLDIYKYDSHNFEEE